MAYSFRRSPPLRLGALAGRDIPGIKWTDAFDIDARRGRDDWVDLAGGLADVLDAVFKA